MGCHCDTRTAVREKLSAPHRHFPESHPNVRRFTQVFMPSPKVPASMLCPGLCWWAWERSWLYCSSPFPGRAGHWPDRADVADRAGKRGWRGRCPALVTDPERPGAQKLLQNRCVHPGVFGRSPVHHHPRIPGFRLTYRPGSGRDGSRTLLRHGFGAGRMFLQPMLLRAPYRLTMGTIAVPPRIPGLVFVGSVAAYTLGRQLLFPLRVQSHTRRGRILTATVCGLILVVDITLAAMA